jgi:hypothetical protein
MGAIVLGRRRQAWHSTTSARARSI